MDENCEALIQSHTFQGIILDTLITFSITKMKDCLFLWMGDSGSFDSLAVAMKTPFNSQPTSCTLLGNPMEDESGSLASKLSRKIGKQVFVSYNVSKQDSRMMMSIIERLLEELSLNPDKF